MHCSVCSVWPQVMGCAWSNLHQVYALHNMSGCVQVVGCRLMGYGFDRTILLMGVSCLQPYPWACSHQHQGYLMQERITALQSHQVLYGPHLPLISFPAKACSPIQPNPALILPHKTASVTGNGCFMCQTPEYPSDLLAQQGLSKPEYHIYVSHHRQDTQLDNKGRV